MLLVMGFFGWRGYQNAVVDTERLATDRAAENNDFAAQLAAQQVAREIANLFEIADDEANRRPVFREKFDLVRLHELLAKLADPEFLQLVQHDTHHRFAALVDGRPGNHMGLVLQHPLFDEITKSGQPLPDSIRSRRVPIDAKGRLNEPRYRDPLGDEELGRAY